MSYYPDRHHPVFFLVDALNALGAKAEFARDERTEGAWGMIVNGRTVVWFIDNRWPHERAKEDPAAERLFAKGALVCCAQKRDAERIGGKWLPLAATPGYEPLQSEKTSDVAFVGYVRDAARSTILTDVAAHHTLALGQKVFGKQAVELYASARIGLNVPTNYYDPNAYDINMRVFEVPATGTPLLTNALPELEALGFIDGKTCLTYESPDDLLSKLDFALSDPFDILKLIGERGFALVRARHTYRHRARQVLQWLQP